MQGFCIQNLLLESQWKFKIRLSVTMALKFFCHDWTLWITPRFSNLPMAFTDTALAQQTPLCCVHHFSVYRGHNKFLRCWLLPQLATTYTHLLNIYYNMVDLSEIIVSKIFILILMSMKSRSESKVIIYTFVNKWICISIYGL